MIGRLVLFIWLCLSLAVLQVTPVFAQEQTGRIIIKENSDYFGFDLLTEKDVTLEQCKSSCLKNLGCAAFTYNTSAKFCFLKSDFGEINPFPGAIAGRIVQNSAEPDIGAPPKLPFVAQYIYNEARKFRLGVKNNKKRPANQGFVSLTNQAQLNVQAGRFKAAANDLVAALIINPGDIKSWLKLSNAARRHKANGSSNRRFFNKIATSSALSGYLVSRIKSDRADALAQLAKGLEARRQYRPALTAYKMSLDLKEVAFERTAFLELRRTRGFRVLNHSVDSDNLNPRICVQFSENLDTKSTDYENFLRLEGKAPKAIDVKARQICVEGLNHGRNYKITLRPGLPSTIGENLLNAVDLNVYVRDRSPAVRFTGSNFVLPLSMRHGIPVVTINTRKANLKLHRVGARGLTSLLRDSRFLKQLSVYQTEYIKDELGEPIWDGSIDIKPELNREVVTSIPIDEALPDRKPGVYMLSATPAKDGAGRSSARATQWFVISDIGLTTFAGSGNFKVMTRSLSSAKPLAGIELTLIARNNEILGKGKTDAAGQVVFDAGLTRGKGGLSPAIISARNGTADFVFLDISNPGFDFSDRGVTGRAVPKGVDVYAWTERGIYRAGESVHVAALARDASANAINDLPLTFVFKRPDGVEDRRIVDKSAQLGGYSVALPLTGNAKRGTWKVQVYVDPKSDPVAEQRFLVEDFLPEKTEFTLAPVEEAIAIGQVGSVEVKGRYLYGAPAAGLTLEGDLVVRSIRSRKGHKNYVFGLAASENGATQRSPIKNMAPLNAQGESVFNLVINNAKATTRPQTAELVVRMREGSGRAVERRTKVDIIPQGKMIGVRPQFDGGQVAENSVAGFNIIAVDPKGQKTTLSNAKWSLVKVERNYQWYRSGSSWRYESIDLESKVANGTIDIAPNTASKLSMPVEWGRYRLDIETASASGPSTSILFNAGWYVAGNSTETPDGLEIALDKSSYKAGDTAKLKVSPRFAGEMLIAIATDRIVETISATIPANGATIDLPVNENWGAGAYVLATLYRPADAGSSRMPMRAIGVKWLSVDPQARSLQVSLNPPAQTRPHEKISIPVSVSNLKPGEEAYVMVAAVDVGILNLTNYKSPNPLKRYFGQRKLGVAMRDIYGKLIDGSLGAVGRLRTGGDGSEGMSTNGSPPTEKLVAFFSGPVKLDASGKAVIEFDIPQFNGSARIMATAWTASGVGASETETIIRDPIVISAALPKFMAPGDQARLLIDLVNTDHPTGTYEFGFETSDNLTLSPEHLIKSAELLAGEKSTITIPVIAKSSGQAWARINLSRADGFSVSHEIALNVRAGQLPVTQKLQVKLPANGGSLVVDEALLGGSKLDGALINVSVAHPSPFDVPSLIMQLNAYPYGCAEQITSKALPLLYVSEFATGIPGLDQATLKERVQKAINKVLSYQSYNGGFSLWGSGRDDLWLGAYVADFLTRAAEKGYRVPAQPMKQALQNLQNVLSYQSDLKTNDSAVAYALYVLARNRQASAGDLRYYADTQLQLFKTPIARAQLAAGMALYGDQQRSERTFASALRLAQQNISLSGNQYSFGSQLRDASAMLALASESRPVPALTARMKSLVSSISKTDIYTSTQEQAWMLLAARADQAANNEISLVVDQAPHSGAFVRRISGNELQSQPVSLENRGAKELQATITTVAVPAQPLPAGGNGFTISRAYYKLDGTVANVSGVTQNERFVVVIKIKQLKDVPSRVIVSDLLPAGFEIDNPRLVGSADLKNFKWLPGTDTAHSEFREDRFIAAFNRAKGGASEFTVAYTVRAVTPGVFLHPAASVEDMYRPQLSARTASGWMEVRSAN